MSDQIKNWEVKNTPRDENNKVICFAASTWAGCPGCEKSHKFLERPHQAARALMARQNLEL